MHRAETLLWGDTEGLWCIQTAASVSVWSEVINVQQAAQRGRGEMGEMSSGVLTADWQLQHLVSTMVWAQVGPEGLNELKWRQSWGLMPPPPPPPLPSHPQKNRARDMDEDTVKERVIKANRQTGMDLLCPSSEDSCCRVCVQLFVPGGQTTEPATLQHNYRSTCWGKQVILMLSVIITGVISSVEEAVSLFMNTMRNKPTATASVSWRMTAR